MCNKSYMLEKQERERSKTLVKILLKCEGDNLIIWLKNYMVCL